MTDQEDPVGSADAPGDVGESAAVDGTPSTDESDDADPTFADGTAREIEDRDQPLTREEEGMDR